MFSTLILRRKLAVLVLVAPLGAAAQTAEVPDLSGNWEIHSSVGGKTPITVNCSLEQTGMTLSGTCTPVMDNAKPSELSGSLDGAAPGWGYSVVFNGNPGTVQFRIGAVEENSITGILSLSGTEAPFTATRK